MNRTAYIGSNTLYAIRLQAVGALTAFAMFFQAGVPLLYNLATPQLRGLMQITICSGGVSKQITVDENGRPVKQAPTSKASGNSCVHHCGGGLLCYASTTTAMPFLLWVMVASSASHLLDELAVAHAHARGPPA